MFLFVLITWTLFAISQGLSQPLLPARALHWVLRTSDLAKSLHFYQKILGMKIFRHEEMTTPCEITCNGHGYNNSWSKTMVGYANTENDGYALELTYNYGVRSYPAGAGLQRIVVRLPHILYSRVVTGAEESGYDAHYIDTRIHAGRKAIEIVGPDRYVYEVVMKENIFRDGILINPIVFVGVRLRIANAAKTVAWYKDMLGMEDVEINDDEEETKSLARLITQVDQSATHRVGAVLAVKFPNDNIMISFESVGARVNSGGHSESGWDGRHAFAMPVERIQTINARLQEEDPLLIIHPLRQTSTITEGIVETILILSDPNGFELCLISHDAFKNAVSFLPTSLPNWKLRKSLEPHDEL